jgi:plastocyanin
MSRLFRLVLLAWISSSPALGTAATFMVQVGGNTNSFSPKSLTINAGDTVIWTNAGGFHNVVADDGSFRNGNASSAAWTFSRTFNPTGPLPTTIGYYCEVHGARGGIGMAGTITVNATTPPSIPLGGYLNGKRGSTTTSSDRTRVPFAIRRHGLPLCRASRGG